MKMDAIRPDAGYLRKGGYLIAVESIDGSDTADLTLRLLNQLALMMPYHLSSSHIPTTATTSTDTWLKQDEAIIRETVALSAAAARTTLIQQQIRPELDRGMVHLCRGYHAAYRAYQHDVNQQAPTQWHGGGDLQPDYTIILDSVGAALPIHEMRRRDDVIAPPKSTAVTDGRSTGEVVLNRLVIQRYAQEHKRTTTVINCNTTPVRISSQVFSACKRIQRIIEALDAD